MDDAFKPARDRLGSAGEGSTRIRKPGLANLLVRHTSASLTMNENADPTVRGDLEAALNRIVPEEWHHTLFEHVEEGPDDMTAHVKSALLGCSLTVPTDATGRMKTGTWQGVYLCEHRNVGGMGVGHAREVATTLVDGAGVANTAGQTTVTLAGAGRGCRDVTAEIAAAAKAIGVGPEVRTGWLNVFVQHTSASLAVCDSTIAGAGDRLERALNETVPESWNDEFFVHTYEGPDDMPGHVKASIVGPSVTVPVVDGELGLGDRQGLFLCEHRDAGVRMQPQPQGGADASGRRQVSENERAVRLNKSARVRSQPRRRVLITLNKRERNNRARDSLTRRMGTSSREIRRLIPSTSCCARRSSGS